MLFCYASGYLEAISDQKQVIFIDEQASFVPAGTMLSSTVEPAGRVVASKSGKTFYYPWCSGRNRIKPENERWFDDSEQALKYGLKPAKNCLGL